MNLTWWLTFTICCLCLILRLDACESSKYPNNGKSEYWLSADWIYKARYKW